MRKELWALMAVPGGTIIVAVALAWAYRKRIICLFIGHAEVLIVKDDQMAMRCVDCERVGIGWDVRPKPWRFMRFQRRLEKDRSCRAGLTLLSDATCVSGGSTPVDGLSGNPI